MTAAIEKAERSTDKKRRVSEIEDEVAKGASAAWVFTQMRQLISAQSAITPTDRDAIIEECARVAYNARLDGAPVEYAIRMLKKFPRPVSPEAGASK
jgi:hypothetical protein